MTELLDDAQESLRLVRDSAASVVPRDKGPQRARALRCTQPGFDRDLWRAMCELGWPGLRVPEARGGTGLGVAALCAVAEELGGSLAPEPFIAAAAAAQHLVGERLASLLRGDTIVVPAWIERPHALDPVGQTSLRGGKLTGNKCLVAGALGAQAFLVPTREGLALVDRDMPGVTVTAVPLHDGSFVANVVFSGAAAEVLAGDFEATLEECAVANAAYLLGAMETAFETTTAYLTVRKQFGKPIGSFQVLQHRAVDMKVQVELTRAVINEAAAALDEHRGSPGDRRALVSRAKMRAADAAMHIAKEAIQFHGAMGMTDECDIGLYARKIFAVHNDWGSVVAHRQRFAAIELARHD
ncbi:MAG: acyl-CoA dehydrogenase family protein [Ramlibacter sp.]